MTDNIIEPDYKSLIFNIRGFNVMVDADLATLYDTDTKVLKQQVKRNQDRFPEDFMFQLTKEEKDELVTNCDRLTTLKHSNGNEDFRRKLKELDEKINTVFSHLLKKIDALYQQKFANKPRRKIGYN